MQPENKVIAVDSTIKEALTLFEKAGIDRAEVKDSSGETIGVLTLKNLKAALAHKLDGYPVNLVVDYFEPQPETLTPPDPADIKNKIDTLFPPAEKEAIFTCSELASKLKLNIYLVGGPVRDLIRNEVNLDLDLTLESNAIDFAKALDKEYPGVTLKEKHPDFKTAKVLFNPGKHQVVLDIASTRKESYRTPGALPTIEQISCPLKEDLFRRDFTVNAMATNISSVGGGEVIDLYGGLSDIGSGVLRVMHSLSFVDDPTRIVRGVEFAVRFGYQFSPATDKLIRACVSSGLFDNFCTGRLKLELKPTLNLNNTKVISFFQELNLFSLIDHTIMWNNKHFSLFENLQQKISLFADYIDQNKIWLVYLAAIMNQLPEDRISVALEKLFLTNSEKETILDGVKLAHQAKQTPLPEKPSQVYDLFHPLRPESIILSTFFRSEDQLCNSIKEYFENYSKVSISTNGKTLIDLGVQPGPVFSEIMKKLIALKLDGDITSKQQELEFIQKHYL